MKKNSFDPFMINSFSNMEKQGRSVSLGNNSNEPDFIGINFLEKNTSMRTPKVKGGLLLLVDSNSIGEENELGINLLKSFFVSISDGIEFPEYIVFINKGVKILVDEVLIDVIKSIKRYGTNIVASFESVEYFNLESNCKIAQKWSIGEITTLIMSANKVIKI